MRKPPKVPRWELKNGVVQCLALVGLRLGEAEALLTNRFPTQATIVFTFAVEEFGKAVLLRRALVGSRETDVLVAVDGFYDHTAKLEAAATEIPAEHLFVGRGSFQVGAFDARAFHTGPSADDWNVRLGAMFVEWVPDSGRWQWGVKTDVEILASSINGVQARLTRASMEWM